MFYNGKIISFIGGIATVLLDNSKIISAKPKGILRYESSLLKPVVGDNVVVEENCNSYLIFEIKERKNLLIRPNVANIDELLIIQSIIEPNINLYLLDKLLAHYESRVDNVSICFTKLDLLTNDKRKEIEEIIKMYNDNGYSTYCSNNSKDIKKIKYNLGHKIMCLAGNSGVGKSTLLNKINPNLTLRTQEISKALNRGKHTTTNNKMIIYENGMFIDTPGFGSIDIFLTSYELANSFHDFHKYSPLCKFSNCLHINEKNCKIKELVSESKISQSRYNNYVRMQEEIKNKKI